MDKTNLIYNNETDWEYIGNSECPFYKYADVLDNGALVNPECELSTYLKNQENSNETEK